MSLEHAATPAQRPATTIPRVVLLQPRISTSRDGFWARRLERGSAEQMSADYDNRRMPRVVRATARR
jgi:hypothetical protein